VNFVHFLGLSHSTQIKEKEKKEETTNIWTPVTRNIKKKELMGVQMVGQVSFSFYFFFVRELGARPRKRESFNDSWRPISESVCVCAYACAMR